MERPVLWQKFRWMAVLVLLAALGMTVFALLMPRPQPEQTDQPTLHGAGTIVYADGVQPLSQGEEAAIQGYFSVWYESLSTLSQGDLTELFTDTLQLQANRSSLELQLALRQAAPVDYSLTGYRYELECVRVERQLDGSVRIGALEDSVQNFAALPGVDSQRFDSYHHFTLVEEDGSWKILTHYQYDVLQMEGLRARMGEEPQAEFPNVSVEELARDYISMAPEYEQAILQAAADREAQRGEQLPEAQPDHSYDRTAAVAYADAWAEGRNPDWVDYSDAGGNCQNFASQSLLAGGIPMDTTGAYVWKWYGTTVANRAGAFGRSSSWSGVKQFMAYAAGNTGYGLQAVADAPYFTGEPGDLIHMGMEEDWRHTVVISQAVADSAGRVRDYLVHSNTGNLRDFPASLYGYADLSLTKIQGWNE